jgi:chromosomal replication initiation ATPase DnaA
MTGPGTPDRGRQLALALPHRPATAREDFLVAPSNALAVAWIDRWPDWPMPGLVVHGPEGCGKSHLAAVWAARADATVLDTGDLVRPGGTPPRRGAAVIVEDVDARVAGDGAAEEGLFHLYNRIVDAKGALLLTGRGAPARWGIALDDLRSRLNALPSAAVSAPDDALLEALFVKHFADRQIRVGRDVVGYLVTRSERSHDAVRRLVARLDRASLADRRTITVRFARRVLETEQG